MGKAFQIQLVRSWAPLGLLRFLLGCGVLVRAVFWGLSLGIEQLMVLVWWGGFLKDSRWGVRLGDLYN